FIPESLRIDIDESPPGATGNTAFVNPRGRFRRAFVNAPLLICEGMTDTAVALSLGYAAVGLPAAGQAVDLVAERVIPASLRSAVIVADLDEGIALCSGDTIWPGIEGGLRLAERLMPLIAEVRFCLPPAGLKDLRQWLNADPTGGDVRRAIPGAPRVHPAW